jgi:ankyrin repeat protein
MVLMAMFDLLPILLAMGPVDDALLKAAFEGDLGEVSMLLKKEVDVNAANGGGFTPLIVATEQGRLDIVAMLLGAARR